jgi:hypothetical protein
MASLRRHAAPQASWKAMIDLANPESAKVGWICHEIVGGWPD